jgi:hypothetical protein
MAGVQHGKSGRKKGVNVIKERENMKVGGKQGGKMRHLSYLFIIPLM